MRLSQDSTGWVWGAAVVVLEEPLWRDDVNEIVATPTQGSVFRNQCSVIKNEN